MSGDISKFFDIDQHNHSSGVKSGSIKQSNKVSRKDLAHLFKTREQSLIGFKKCIRVRSLIQQHVCRIKGFAHVFTTRSVSIKESHLQIHHRQVIRSHRQHQKLDLNIKHCYTLSSNRHQVRC